MSFLTTDELQAALKANVDEIWFIDYFEITIDDLVDRFSDLIELQQRDLPYELGLMKDFIPDED